MSENLFDSVFNELLILSNPVRGATNDEESLKLFFRKMGWNFDADSGMPIANITSTINQVTQLIQTIRDLVEESQIESLDQVLQLLTAAKSLFETITNLVDSFDGANLPQDQITEVIEDIPHYLFVKYLEKKHFLLVEILRWIEVVQTKTGTETRFNTAGKIIRYPFEFEVVNFDNLAKFLSNPAQAIKDIYLTPFDRNTVTGAKAFTDKLFPRLGRLAGALGGIYVYGIKPGYEIDFGSAGNEMASGALSVKWRTPLDEFLFGVTIAYSPKERGNLGWIIVPFGELTLDTTLGDYSLQIKSALQVGGIIIGEDGSISFEASGGLAKISAELLVLKVADMESGLSYLFGETDGTRLELGKVSIGASFEATTSSIDFDVHVNIDEAKFVISRGGQDGFIANIIPEEGIEVPFDFLLGYSTKKSLYFGVNAGLEFALPVHIDVLGILRVEEIYLKIKTQDYGLKTETSLSGGVSLGPLAVSFEEIGLQSKLDVKNPDKNIGFANIGIDFKPPNGLGLSINAGAVIGGGYLFFDFEKQEYAGALELTIANFISAKAIGLITTKMPDGSPGFSMLIIITAEFNPPFQLGYGFTLIGVGGLLGLNRTVLLQPLRDGVRTGAVNNIVFPQNVIANISRIISDLKTIFPPYDGKFLIGPMGKLGWGTPTLISLSFGLIIEIPGNLAILGVLGIVLPDKDAPIVNIKVAFVGTLDFDKKMLTFDASLYESSILTMTLEGDMAVRLKWGDSPDFLLTVGGFHPSYTPPPLALPTLKRLAINILNTDIAKIRVECYQAVTSNTVQFGAKAEILFDLSACSIEGYIAFDALFQFSPFYFIITLSAGFKLSAAGIDVLTVRVRMSLEGPTPWRAKGTGSVSLLFFEISADFDKTWGEEINTALPDIEIFPRLIEDLNKREQWSTVLTSGKNLLVTLRKLEEGSEDLLVFHPAGSLVVQQKLLPLSVNIEKVGNQKTSDVKQAKIASASSNGVSLALQTVSESFARAQYQNLTDAEKLSTPSFEKMPGGVQVTIGNQVIKNGKMVRKKVEYELTIIDKEPKKPLAFGKFLGELSALFANFLKGNSVSKSTLSKSYAKKLAPFEQKLNLMEEGYTVAFQADNKPYNSEATFANEIMAESYMQDLITNKPSLNQQVHVIPNYELQQE